jgi:hypothetical protein
MSQMHGHSIELSGSNSRTKEADLMGLRESGLPAKKENQQSLLIRVVAGLDTKSALRTPTG